MFGLGWLKAIYDNLATVDTVVDTNQDLLDGTTATPNAHRREYGRLQVKEISVTALANAASDTTLGTVTAQPCVIESIVIHADTVQPAHLTTCPVHGGAAKVVTFIGVGDATQANLDAIDKQVAWTGAVRLAATKTIVMVHNGTGVDPLDLTVTITYHAAIDGGYLA